MAALALGDDQPPVATLTSANCSPGTDRGRPVPACSRRPDRQALPATWALGVGLAGALLAELIFAGTIRIRADRIYFPAEGLPGDDLGRQLLAVLLAEPDRHPVRDWLMFLAATSARDVGSRLEQDGYLAQVSSRRPWRGAKRVPADADAAFAPLIRVRAVLDPASTTR